MRKLIVTVIATLFLLVAGATAAGADPSFGPGAGNGQGNNAPHDSGAKCHPPGQTVDVPGCK